jgi:hypothetical protein
VLAVEVVGSVLSGSLALLRETVGVLLESTPKGLELAEVRERLIGHPHVHDVHDLHASQVTTGLPVLTAHVVVDDSCLHDGHLGGMLDELQGSLDTDFDVEHSTIQFEGAGHAAREPGTHACTRLPGHRSLGRGARVPDSAHTRKDASHAGRAPFVDLPTERGTTTGPPSPSQHGGRVWGRR